MKKLLIAGYASNIQNYQTAFSFLGIPAESLDIHSLPCSHYDGLVLPGGGDISPSLFHAANNGSRNIDESLDRLQLAVLDIFLKLKKPVLGICKGMQLINVYFGGTLIQDLQEESLKIHSSPQGDLFHFTKSARGTFTELLYGRNPVTNSAHHQGIGSLGDELLISQYSSDFVVEALYHHKLPVFGVQWHPERMCPAFARPEADSGIHLLKYFCTFL